jgi:hypothetical protein
MRLLMKHLEVLKAKLESIDNSGITIQTQKGPFKVITVKARGEVIGVNVSNLGTSHIYH